RQDVAQASLQSIVPDLATGWTWSEDGTELTFPLRQGVKWHDGKPFTAKDVKCTWDLLQGKANEKLRVNPRKSWYNNLEEVTTNGDYEVTFRLKRQQPWLLTLLASGWSPIYPCHVPARDMRQRPIGTGPFKFVEFKPNEHIKVVRNPDYWKPDRPYLDGIDWMIIKDQGTRVLSFVAGKNDLFSPYGVTMPLLHQIKEQAPQAICEVTATNVNRTLVVNRDKPPFSDLELRRAMSRTLDPLDTTQWYPALARRDFTVALNVTETGVDDPDQQFYENYVCGAERNYTGYCNPEVDKLVDDQSMQADPEKRKHIVWEIERRLIEDVARPVIFYPRQA